MDIKSKTFGVIGLGATGYDTAVFLKRKGASVFVSEKEKKPALLEKKASLAALGIDVEIGEHSFARLLGFDWLVISPGVNPKSGVYQIFRERKGERFISEIELASMFFQGDLIAVTGTNGKTTVTRAIAGLLNQRGMKAFYCGNIGNPFVGELERQEAGSKAVVEVSSFQLENIKTFRPKVALILNITPDHLDWHRGFDDYVRAKAKIFANQGPDDFAILNFQDRSSAKLASSVSSKVIFFNEKENENPNWDAVAKVGEVFGIAPQASMDYLRSFPGIEHRMERLSSQDGITYINDSKSTNPSSLEWALRLMKSKVILLAGGRNKGSDFSPLAPLVGEKVKSAVLFGEAREEMAQAWKDGTQCHLVNDLNEAFGFAADSASSGDTILFSPGCASFDQFRNYEERGTKFKKLVRQLRTVRR